MTFTVIIPTCRRPESLARCLSSLPVNVEIIVADDGDGREAPARAFPQVLVIAGPGRGPAANRNCGAAAAKTDWLAFVDDDCEPQAGWVEALAKAAEDADVVEGRTLAPGASDSFFEEHVENESGGVLWGCNFAIRRDAFVLLGGFDEDFTEAAGEDMEFASRVSRSGLRVKFAPEALVYHPPRRIGWRGIWKRMAMNRWMPLYRLKTGGAPPLGAGAARVALALLRSEIAMTLRLAIHAFTRPAKHPRKQLFQAGLRLFTLPLLLPYNLVWDFRFRRELASRL